jgi:excisionase family DNA binding protein
VLNATVGQNNSMRHTKGRNGTTEDNDRRVLATYKPVELARILGIARNSVYDALRSGKIPHVRVGRRFLIPKTAVKAWLASAFKESK